MPKRSEIRLERLIDLFKSRLSGDVAPAKKVSVKEIRSFSKLGLDVLGGGTWLASGTSGTLNKSALELNY